QVLRGQRHPWPLIIKQQAGDPVASASMHNLERIDASRGLGIVLRIPAFLCAPNLDKIAKLLDAGRDAALEETVRLEVGIVLLHEHVGSQQKNITLACRFILCGRGLRNNPAQPAVGHKQRAEALPVALSSWAGNHVIECSDEVVHCVHVAGVLCRRPIWMPCECADERRRRGCGGSRLLCARVERQSQKKTTQYKIATTNPGIISLVY